MRQLSKTFQSGDAPCPGDRMFPGEVSGMPGSPGGVAGVAQAHHP